LSGLPSPRPPAARKGYQTLRVLHRSEGLLLVQRVIGAFVAVPG